jgi:serine/threonine protein kinase
MDTQRDLLFGLLAYQKGLIDADCLAETRLDGPDYPTVPLADQLVDRGVLTVEQKDRLGEAVEAELEAHGGDVQATLAANLDGRTLDAVRGSPSVAAALRDGLTAALEPKGHVLIESLGAEEGESRERYTLSQLYAKGGMGQVWLAHDPALGREIALKELRPDQAGNDLICTRFLTEARVTAQLEHPGIIPVYELGETNVPFYTMRFIKGGTLGQAARGYHKARVAGTADQVGMVKLLSAFVGVCHAIAYAHSRGFIHRDLKGQNVVLGAFGEVIVLDWGLAKRIRPNTATEPFEVLDGHAHPHADVPVIEVPAVETLPPATDVPAIEVPAVETLPPADVDLPTAVTDPHRAKAGPEPELTIQGQVLGTPAFMAPEQAEGRQDRTDALTDVYGLGAILYEILTGQPPFHARTTNELLRKVRTEPPVPPRQINPEVDPALQAVCLKALSKEPQARYASALELAQEVQRFLADEPVTAWPEPWTRRAARWARKHRTGVAAAACLLATATVALAVSTVLISRERNEATLQGEQARSAVDDMYVKVAENLLEDRLDPLQKELLEKALNYYEKFAGYAAHTPKVKLEKGQAYRRMGEIHRKLGRFDEADRSFRQALVVLEPLAGEQPADPEVRRVLALTRSRTGDFLVRGNRLDEAEQQLKLATDALEPPAAGQAPAAEDRWLLARALRSRGEILRRKGSLPESRAVAARACELFEQVLAADPGKPEVQYDLAQASDFLGRVDRELGDEGAREKAFRRAYDLLDSLISTFPTVPRYREAMSHVCNGLGEYERTTGRAADCERYWRRELKETERLAEDFPDRPEYQRLLAGSCSNLGGILAEQDRFAEGEPILRRGISLGSALLKKDPQDREVQFDLGVCSYNLGYLQFKNGQAEQALATLEETCKVEQALSSGPQALPRSRRLLALAFRYRGESLDALGRKGADEAYREGIAILEKLTAEFPSNVLYQIDYAQCLNKLADKLVQSGKADEAEASYQRALAALDARQVPKWPHNGRLEKAMTLSNLANFRHEAKRPGAEPLLHQSIELASSLAAGTPPGSGDHRFLALARNNLGEILRDLGRDAEALVEFQASIDGLKPVVAASPNAAQDHFYLGHVYDQQGKTLLKAGKAADAKLAFSDAVAQQKAALKANDRFGPARLKLVAALGELAQVELSLGDYPGLRDAAAELAQAAPRSPETQFDAARLLARGVLKLQGDAKVSAAHKDDLGRECLGRVVVMLRQAVDLDAKLAETIPTDPVFKELLDRPAFRSMVSSLVRAEQEQDEDQARPAR